MPSWSIHIALAHKLKEKYHFNDDFILGNVLPDATNGFVLPDISHIIRHSITHYNFMGPGKPPKNDIQKFLEFYQKRLDNPLILGSYIHLLTDNFYNEYTLKHHIERIDGKNVAVLKDGTIDQTVTPWRLKQEDFRRFGDYLVYQKRVGGKIHLSDQTIALGKDLAYQLTEDDLELICKKINSIVDKEVSKTPHYRMFKESEFIMLFDQCYDYLDRIIEDLIQKEKRNEYVRKKI